MNIGTTLFAQIMDYSVRDWRIYADFAQILIRKARKLYAGENFGIELKQVAYALDATTIDLCLSLFPWAKFRKTKAAIKLHTLLDLRGNIPTTIIITPGNIHEVNILDELCIEPLAIYIMDRGYLDFARLHMIHSTPAFFVTSRQDHRSKVRSDRLSNRILFKERLPRKDSAHWLFRCGDQQAFDISDQQPETFRQNYCRSLQITLAGGAFLQMGKTTLANQGILRNLRERGKDANLSALGGSIYVLIAIVRKELNLNLSLYTILQILSVALFEKIPILQALAEDRYATENITSWEHYEGYRWDSSGSKSKVKTTSRF